VEAARLGDVDFLAQGTLYPTSSSRSRIVGNPRSSRASQRRRPARAHADELVEPLRELFKDEVREVGRKLASRKSRRPLSVSGPGLAVRILGEITPARFDRFRLADASCRRRSSASGGTRGCGRVSPCLLPIQSVRA